MQEMKKLDSEDGSDSEDPDLWYLHPYTGNSVPSMNEDAIQRCFVFEPEPDETAASAITETSDGILDHYKLHELQKEWEESNRLHIQPEEFSKLLFEQQDRPNAIHLCRVQTMKFEEDSYISRFTTQMDSDNSKIEIDFHFMEDLIEKDAENKADTERDPRNKRKDMRGIDVLLGMPTGLFIHEVRLFSSVKPSSL